MASLIRRSKLNSSTGKKEDYWMITDRVDGKQVARALGFVPKSEAERLLAICRGEVAKGEQPLKRSDAPSTPRLAEYWPRLDKRMLVEGGAESTREQARHCGKPLLRLLGDQELGELRGEVLEDYVLARKDDGVRSRTIQIELRYLRQLLEIAVEEKLLAEAPRLPKLSQEDKRVTVWLTHEELGLLVAHLPWKTEFFSALAIYVLANLGARKGEIFSRRWADIRWNQGPHGSLWIGNRVEGQAVTWSPKTRRGRVAPLPSCVADVLRQVWIREGQPKDGWIFPSAEDETEPLQDIRKALEGACKRAGIPRITPHGLRHSWATAQAMAGTPKATTMLVGGWKDPRTL
ncbi:MAG TPA: tyrosine-type recombinase/integrase, partial [Myxococcota bacterium]|nr:tyrosine-type recombinase/integrase [Myxococcota bacterium]